MYRLRSPRPACPPARPLPGRPARSPAPGSPGIRLPWASPHSNLHSNSHSGRNPPPNPHPAHPPARLRTPEMTATCTLYARPARPQNTGGCGRAGGRTDARSFPCRARHPSRPWSRMTGVDNSLKLSQGNRYLGRTSASGYRLIQLVLSSLGDTSPSPWC